MIDTKPAVEIWHADPDEPKRPFRRDKQATGGHRPTPRPAGWHWWLGVGAALLGAILIILFVGGDPDEPPAIAPDATAGLSSQIDTLQTRLSQCTDALTLAATAVDNSTGAIAKAVGAVDAKLKQCEIDLDLTTEDYDEQAEYIDELEDALAAAAAKLCCVQRAYDNSINSYSLDDGTIACGSGLATAITC